MATSCLAGTLNKNAKSPTSAKPVDGHKKVFFAHLDGCFFSRDFSDRILCFARNARGKEELAILLLSPLIFIGYWNICFQS